MARRKAPTKKRNDTSAKSRRTVRRSTGKSKKKDTTGTYKGVLYDSLEELYFLYWAYELKNQGIIKKIERAKSYLLSDALVHNYAEQLKTKSKPKTQVLLFGHSYTPEFTIYWVAKKPVDKLIWGLDTSIKKEAPIVVQNFDGELVSTVEIKPMFDQNSMERLFKVNQKWMWEKHRIFVNLIKVGELFPKTFTPKEYLHTKTGVLRKLKWEPRSIFQFLNGSK